MKNDQIKIRSNNIIFYQNNTDPKPVNSKLLRDYNIIEKINYIIICNRLSIAHYCRTILL